MAAPYLGTGATFTYTGFTGSIMSISVDSLYERQAIQTSHLGTTTAHSFIPSTLYDAGGCTIEFQTDSGVAYGTPATAVASSLVITWATGLTVTVSAFMTSMTMNMELETLQTGTATFKFTGAVTLDTTP